MIECSPPARWARDFWTSTASWGGVDSHVHDRYWRGAGIPKNIPRSRGAAAFRVSPCAYVLPQRVPLADRIPCVSSTAGDRKKHPHRLLSSYRGPERRGEGESFSALWPPGLPEAA